MYWQRRRKMKHLLLKMYVIKTAFKKLVWR